MKPYNFYSLILAVMHAAEEIPSLKIQTKTDQPWRNPRRPWRLESDVLRTLAFSRKLREKYLPLTSPISLPHVEGNKPNESTTNSLPLVL